MLKISISTMIYRPVRQVFDFVSRPENDFEWQYGTLVTARLSNGAITVGAIFRSIGHLMGRRNLSTFEVTEYEPEKKFSFKSISGPLQAHTSYTFEAAEGGTLINVSTQANVVNFFQANESVLEKSYKKQLRENLALLKGLLEAKQLSSPLRQAHYLTGI